MALTPTPPSALGSSHPLPHKLTSTVLLVFPARLGTLPGSRHSGANGFLQQLQQVTATNAAFVNRILQRDTVVQHDGPSIARIINEVGDKHRQQQEPSLYSSAAPKGACNPHCSHIDSQSATLSLTTTPNKIGDQLSTVTLISPGTSTTKRPLTKVI